MRTIAQNILPQFVGSNYFCESGNNTTVGAVNIDKYNEEYYLETPLWDGKG